MTPDIPFRSRNFVLREAFRLAEQSGVTPEQVLGHIGVEHVAVWRQDEVLPARIGIEALEVAAQMSGRDDFGLELGVSMDTRILGAMMVFLAHCTSLSQISREVSNYMHVLYGGVTYWTPDDGRSCEVRFDVNEDIKRPLPHYFTMMLVLPVRVFRNILGPDWAPARVSLVAERLAPLQRYRDVFGCDVTFGAQANAIHVAPDDWNRTFDIRATGFQATIDSLLSNADPSARSPELALRNRVIDAICELLPSGSASAQRVAGVLNLSMRTMQRDLAELGTSFSDLRREAMVRAERAKTQGPRRPT